MMEDYRALGIDRHRQATAPGRRIACPLLYLWAKRDDMEDLYGDPLAIWRDWADDARGQSVDCGHHIAEEARPSSRRSWPRSSPRLEEAGDLGPEVRQRIASRAR